MKHGSRWKDLTGQKFGKLIVLGFSHKATNNQSIWSCICDCGKHTKVRTSNLTLGKVVSCGCYRLSQAKRQTQETLQDKGLEAWLL